MPVFIFIYIYFDCALICRILGAGCRHVLPKASAIAWPLEEGFPLVLLRACCCSALDPTQVSHVLSATAAAYHYLTALLHPRPSCQPAPSHYPLPTPPAGRPPGLPQAQGGLHPGGPPRLPATHLQLPGGARPVRGCQLRHRPPWRRPRRRPAGRSGRGLRRHPRRRRRRAAAGRGAGRRGRGGVAGAAGGGCGDGGWARGGISAGGGGHPPRAVSGQLAEAGAKVGAVGRGHLPRAVSGQPSQGRARGGVGKYVYSCCCCGGDSGAAAGPL